MDLDFDDIYREFQPKIHRYVTKMAGPEDAEDITQEVFLKVDRSLGGFRGGSSLSTWIYRIAANTALDKLRSPSRRSSYEYTDSELEAMDRNVWTDEKKMDTDEESVRKEMNECIREFIERLPPDYRSVLLLSEIEGLKNREIADISGLTLENVKVRLHRGRARLRQELQKGCDFYQDPERGLSCDRKSHPIDFKRSE